MQWQDHLKKCARKWREWKLARQNEEKPKKRKSAPPKVPRQVRGKKVDPERNMN